MDGGKIFTWKHFLNISEHLKYSVIVWELEFRWYPTNWKLSHDHNLFHPQGVWQPSWKHMSPSCCLSPSSNIWKDMKLGLGLWSIVKKIKFVLIRWIFVMGIVSHLHVSPNITGWHTYVAVTDIMILWNFLPIIQWLLV